MKELLELLPQVMLYLASGFAFISCFYFFTEKRYDFFSEISFWIMLVWGFLLSNIIKSLPNIFNIDNEKIKNIIVISLSACIGIVIGVLRNYIEEMGNQSLIGLGRRKTFVKSFWYSILDYGKPVTVRLKKEKQNTILEGVLIRISEDDENPYLLLGYCMKYDLMGRCLDKRYKKDKSAQMIVRPNEFDEIILIYSEGSSKIIELKLED